MISNYWNRKRQKKKPDQAIPSPCVINMYQFLILII